MQTVNAISPNIFDAHADTNILLPLVLGNLLSPKLWDLSEKIHTKLIAAKQLTTADNHEDHNDSLELIRTIQHQIDRHFKHLHPGEVSAIYGELNISDERARLGAQRVDHSLGLIENTFKQRLASGSIPAGALDPLFTQIKSNRFPAFYYSNFDIVVANKALTGRRSSAPMGLTSCLDEVAIFAALAMTMPKDEITNVIALTSASHYTAFGWMRTGEPWWFYGKNKLFSKQDWTQFVNEKFNGNAQSAFDSIFKDMDHIVSVAGTWNLSVSTSSIADDHVASIIEKLDDFFGCRLEQLTMGMACPINRMEESPLAPVLRNLLGSQSIEQARLTLRNEGNPELSQVLYSFRSLDVTSLTPYLEAARHQPMSKALGTKLNSTEEALTMIHGIAGCQSIFNDRNRIAMPDETLRLKTGSDRDKALLLHVLLEHMFNAQSSSAHISTIFTSTDSFVCVDDFCIEINSLSQVSCPTEGIIWKLPN